MRKNKPEPTVNSASNIACFSQFSGVALCVTNHSIYALVSLRMKLKSISFSNLAENIRHSRKSNINILNSYVEIHFINILFILIYLCSFMNLWWFSKNVFPSPLKWSWDVITNKFNMIFIVKYGNILWSK